MKPTLLRKEAMAEPGRTGRQVMQPAGYRAFIPVALPYDPPLRYSPAVLALLSTDTARRIQRLRDEHRTLVTARFKRSTTGIQLLNRLFERPVVTVPLVQDLLGRSYPAANDLVASFVDLGLLREITGGARHRVFQYDPYVAIFGELKP